MTTASVARRQPERRPAIKCTKRKSPSRGGGPCGAYAVKGTVPPICAGHGGKAPQVRRKARVRAELQAWGLDAPTVDPGETMLKLVAQSAERVRLYARLLGEAYEAERESDPAVAHDTLERVLGNGIGALIGYKRSAAADGTIYRSEEIIRGLVDLEMRERKLCADFASKAIAAGLNERLVRVAEQQGAMILAMMRAVLGDQRLGLTEAQLAAAPMIIESHVAELLGE